MDKGVVFCNEHGKSELKSFLRGCNMQQPQAALEILNGWKDIASHLGKGVRTVQRYEREFALPIRRPAGNLTGSVMATKAELDGWVVASPIREAFRLPQPPVDNATPLRELRCHIQEMHRLREEAAELRAAVKASLKLLRENLRLALPQQDQTRAEAELGAWATANPGHTYVFVATAYNGHSV